MIDTRLRDALVDLARDAPEGRALLERTQRRIRRARQRRVAGVGMLLVGMLTAFVGVLAARETGHRRQDVAPVQSTFTPTTDAPPTTALPTTAPPTTTADTAATMVVPDVVGRAESDAVAALRQLGFDPAVERVNAPVGTGLVFLQVPGATARELAGYPIRLWTCSPGSTCPPPSQPDARFVAWTDVDITTRVWEPLTGGPIGATPGEALQTILQHWRSSAQPQERYAGEVVQADAQNARLETRARNAPDDSSYGSDYEITLAHTDAGWTIASVRQRVLCQPNRGAYPMETCI